MLFHLFEKVGLALSVFAPQHSALDRLSSFQALEVFVYGAKLLLSEIWQPPHQLPGWNSRPNGFQHHDAALFVDMVLFHVTLPRIRSRTS